MSDAHHAPIQSAADAQLSSALKEGDGSASSMPPLTDRQGTARPADPGALPVAALNHEQLQNGVHGPDTPRAEGDSPKVDAARLWFEVESPSSSGANTPHRIPSHESLLPDSFTQHLVAGARRLRTAVERTIRTERVSFVDIAHNPWLAARARAELDPLGFASSSGNGHDHAQEFHRATELERQSAAVGAIVADAAEESRVNTDLASLLCARLDASRRATERLLGVLQAMAQAEAAYVRVMRTASHVNLSGDCDGPAMRSAMQRFSDLPYVLSEGHATVNRSLVDITRGVLDVVNLVRKEAALISAESSRSHRAVGHARHALDAAFAEHRRACRAADAATANKTTSSPSYLYKAQHNGLPLDPWLTEARSVTAHGALHAAQAAERTLLTGGLGRVKTLEGRRSEVVRNTIDAFLACYSSELVHMDSQQVTTALRGLVGHISADEDLAELSLSAAAAQQTVQALADRQATALEAASQELLASPEILRQGEMAKWVTGSGTWRDAHCVLTRAGFLHCLADMGEALPQDSICLANTAFVTGDAPEFQLIETTPARVSVFARQRVLRFKAPSIEDCCEWAISLREGIAAAREG